MGTDRHSKRKPNIFPALTGFVFYLVSISYCILPNNISSVFSIFWLTQQPLLSLWRRTVAAWGTFTEPGSFARLLAGVWGFPRSDFPYKGMHHVTSPHVIHSSQIPFNHFLRIQHISGQAIGAWSMAAGQDGRLVHKEHTQQTFAVCPCHKNHLVVRSKQMLPYSMSTLFI